MLEVRDLEVAYGRLPALGGVSLHVGEGEAVGLLGANGAGKSTLLRAVSGLLRPRRGSIRFLGREIAGAPPHTVVRLGLAQVPEGREIFGPMTVRENLELGAYGRHRADPAGVAQDLAMVLALFPILAERQGQVAGSLSGGEQQQLAIGRALMARPRLLLLDEPSLGLAPLVIERIVDVLQQLIARRLTILLVEQNAEVAFRLVQRLYVLEAGRVVREGATAEFGSVERIADVYLGRASP